MRAAWDVCRAGARVVVEVARLILIALGAFLNFKEGDGVREMSEKSASFAIRRTLYFFADYGLWLVSVALFTAMKTSRYSIVEIWSALWIWEFLAAGAFVLLYEKWRMDLSLGEDFRRAKDAVAERSHIAGLLTTLGIIVLAAVWTGPEKIIIFFRKEIRTVPRVVTVTAVLTAVQALVWTLLYDLGYGLVVELF